MQNNQNKNLVLIQDLGLKFTSPSQKDKRRYGLYKCICGKEFETQIRSVETGHTKSCGCYKLQRLKECKTTHGHSKDSLYFVWHSMVNRCTNSKNPNYKHYGERGITVSIEWLDINNFIKDMKSSFEKGMELDRIDNNKGYSKDNCRWTSREIQNRNTRVLRSTNRSGYRGVAKVTRTNRYSVGIIVNSKRVHIGTFVNPLDGALAYDQYIIDNNLEHTKNFS